MTPNIYFEPKCVNINVFLNFLKSLKMSSKEFLVLLKFEGLSVLRFYPDEIKYAEFKEMIISEFEDLDEIYFMKWNDDIELNTDKDLNVIKKLQQKTNQEIVIYINKHNDCYETNVDALKATEKEVEFMRTFVFKGLKYIPSKHMKQNIIYYIRKCKKKKMLVVEYKKHVLAFCPGCLKDVNYVRGMNKHKCDMYDKFEDKLTENGSNQVEINGNIWKVLQGV